MADPIQAPSPTRGIATSEGILTIVSVLVSLLSQYEGAIPAPWGTVAAAVLTAVYTIARTLLKVPT